MINESAALRKAIVGLRVGRSIAVVLVARFWLLISSLCKLLCYITQSFMTMLWKVIEKFFIIIKFSFDALLGLSSQPQDDYISANLLFALYSTNALI